MLHFLQQTHLQGARGCRGFPLGPTDLLVLMRINLLFEPGSGEYSIPFDSIEGEGKLLR